MKEFNIYFYGNDTDPAYADRVVHADSAPEAARFIYSCFGLSGIMDYSVDHRTYGQLDNCHVQFSRDGKHGFLVKEARR